MLRNMKSFHTQTARLYIDSVYGNPVACRLILLVPIFNAQPFPLMDSFKNTLENLVHTCALSLKNPDRQRMTARSGQRPLLSLSRFSPALKTWPYTMEGKLLSLLSQYFHDRRPTLYLCSSFPPSLHSSGQDAVYMRFPI